jgi:hypothetical protein
VPLQLPNPLSPAKLNIYVFIKYFNIITTAGKYYIEKMKCKKKTQEKKTKNKNQRIPHCQISSKMQSSKRQIDTPNTHIHDHSLSG